MYIPFYSLRTGILAHLAFLIVSAMLLINVVMVKFAEKDLFRAKLRTGSAILQMLKQRLEKEFVGKGGKLHNLGPDSRIREEIIQLVTTGGFRSVLLIDNMSNKVLTSGMGGIYPKGILIGEVAKVEKEKGRLYKYAIVKPSSELLKLEEVLCLR